jgi:hypothetical protein
MLLEVFFIVSNAKSLLVSVIILVGHKREGCGDLKYSMLGHTTIFYITTQLDGYEMNWSNFRVGCKPVQKLSIFSNFFPPFGQKRLKTIRLI